jgi:hypothetical protein
MTVLAAGGRNDFMVAEQARRKFANGASASA